MSQFEIHLPEEKRGSISQEPKYAAMFLDRLSQSSKTEFLVEISGGMVLCGEKPVAELLTMLFRAKKFDQFLSELNQLFFSPSEPGSMGTLSCMRNEQALGYSVTQVKPMPALKLRIRRVT